MKGALFYLFDYIAGKVDFFTVVSMFFSVLVVIFLCFPVHECAHALVAKLLGDDTAEREGRITLNPIAHIDPMGALCMCVCRIGWAKPTPVDLRRCRKVTMRTANILVSLAGPVSNLILALIVLIIFKILTVTGALEGESSIYIIIGLVAIVETNIYLMIFNLIPVPPFDGYHVLATFLSAKALRFMEENGRIINFIVFMLLISNVLNKPLSIISNWVFQFLDLITSFIC